MIRDFYQALDNLHDLSPGSARQYQHSRAPIITDNDNILQAAIASPEFLNFVNASRLSPPTSTSMALTPTTRTSASNKFDTPGIAKQREHYLEKVRASCYNCFKNGHQCEAPTGTSKCDYCASRTRVKRGKRVPKSCHPVSDNTIAKTHLSCLRCLAMRRVCDGTIPCHTCVKYNKTARCGTALIRICKPKGFRRVIPMSATTAQAPRSASAMDITHALNAPTTNRHVVPPTMAVHALPAR